MRGFDTTLAMALVDGRYEEGAFESPDKLIVNPDADPKDWKRVAPKHSFKPANVEDFTKEELAEILNYVADLRAQWRISNTKQQIINKGRESATKQNEKAVLLAVEKWNSDHVKYDVLIEGIVDSFGKAECIRILAKNRVMLPSHPLLSR